MKWLGTLALMVAMASSSVNAAVKEEKVKLPDELGAAVIYHSDNSKTKGPGVVVVHEWWGLNDYARQRAKMLAEAGYTAIAVDMYGTGKVADHPKDAMSFMKAAQAEPEKMNARFEAALQILGEQAGVDKHKLYGVGYCFGGAVVLNQARRGLELAGVASFHGALDSDQRAEPGVVKAAVLVATGGADPMVPADQVAALTEEMMAAGVKLQILSFPGVKHGFTNPAATAKGEEFNMPLAYDAEADRESWAALLKMLEH